MRILCASTSASSTSVSSACPVFISRRCVSVLSCAIAAMSRRASSNSCAASTRRNAIFTALCTRIFCSSASISASSTSFLKTSRLSASFPPMTIVCCTKIPCFPPPIDPPRISSPVYATVGFRYSPACCCRALAARISASACRNVGFDSPAIFSACSSVNSVPFAFSCALPIRGYSGLTAAICIGWCCSCAGIFISCARPPPAIASKPAITITPHSIDGRMVSPLLLRELCILCVETFFNFSRLMVMLRCRAGCLLSREDGVIFFLRQHAYHGHHSHHSRAPIFRQAVGFRLFYGFVHAHFHESILRKSQHALRVLRDRRVVHVLERNAFRERFHLAHRFHVRLVGGLDLPVTQQIHHAVHHVVRQVAVDHPRAGIFRLELHDARLRHSHQHGVHRNPRRFRRAPAFCAGDHELVPVQVDGVMIHSKIDDAQPHPASQPREQRRRHRRGNSVERQPVELHRCRVRNGIARQHRPFLQDQSVVMIRAWLVIFLRMRHEKSDLPHHFLHGAMRVVEKRPFLVHGEFVNVLLAGSDRLLADVRYAVLFDGDFQPMPVRGSGLRQSILEDHAHAIALLHLNRRPGAASVVAPRVDGLERRDSLLHRLGYEAENFNATIHLVRQIRQIRRHHGQRCARSRRV